MLFSINFFSYDFITMNDKIEKTGIINFLESNHENYKICN